MVAWKATIEEVRTITKIVKRSGAQGSERLAQMMDLEAVHSNGCPLDFEKLLAFDDFNFWHDMNGIRACVNRETGELGNNFLPRCALHQ